MTNFVFRWRLSRLHDEGQNASPALSSRIARSPELSRHARALDLIDQELTGHAPIAQPTEALRRRTLTMISELPRPGTTPARAPLWPLLTSLTTAAVAIMLFVAQPWHTTVPIRHPDPSPPLASGQGLHHPFDANTDHTVISVNEALSVVNDTRQIAQSFLRDALPFAPSSPAK